MHESTIISTKEAEVTDKEFRPIIAGFKVLSLYDQLIMIEREKNGVIQVTHRLVKAMSKFDNMWKNPYLPSRQLDKAAIEWILEANLSIDRLRHQIYRLEKFLYHLRHIHGSTRSQSISNITQKAEIKQDNNAAKSLHGSVQRTPLRAGGVRYMDPCEGAEKSDHKIEIKNSEVEWMEVVD